MKPGSILLDRYQIEKMLGQGGMGAVYEAKDTFSDNKPCAVKERVILVATGGELTRLRLPDNSIQDEPQADGRLQQAYAERFRTQFREEATLLKSLSHPNLHACNRILRSSDGSQYIIMDLVEGRNLQEIREARGGALPEDEVMTWMSQVMDAIDYVHQSHISHGDIKPENIRITPEGKAFLVDFGIAGFVGQSPLTGFTQHYTAPEVRKKSKLPHLATSTHWGPRSSVS